jgi:hypothetical protein
LQPRCCEQVEGRPYTTCCQRAPEQSRLLTSPELSKSGVSVEKVPQLMLVAVQCSGYKQARVLDAVGIFHQPSEHTQHFSTLQSIDWLTKNEGEGYCDGSISYQCER